MDSRTREILQIDVILDLVAKRASSSLGREYVKALEPSVTLNDAQRRASPVRDLVSLLNNQGTLPIAGLADIRPGLDKARIEGSLLDEQDWPPVQQFLSICAGLARFRDEQGAVYKALARLMGGFEDHADLRRAVERTFDSAGNIRDDASPELESLRRRVKDSERALLRTVNRLIGDLNSRGYLQENFSTIRNGRHVVPVKASHRGRLRGVLHGSSASGETYYVEPIEVIEASNEVEALTEDERREVHRILLALTAQLRPLVGVLKGNVESARELDGLLALARVAVERGWSLINLVEDGALRLFNAHHPLLHLESPGTSIPVTMLLDPQDRCLVFSGPNAGGKTTAMKTVATLSYLAQCGSPVPAFPDSTIPVFSNLLADIGDQQDLQAGLSTFSGHIRRIKQLWEKSGPRTLVLLDELGTGTDPQEGVALALALLESFLKRSRLTITTSHLNPVKQWAEDTAGARNASFSLDPGTRHPTFKLRLDIPGASEALEIASREGLPTSILAKARELVGERHLQMGEMLRRIEDRERKLAAAVKDAEARAQSLAEQESVARARAELLREERREQKLKAIAEREKAVAEVRTRLEALIADLPSEDQLARRREGLVRARLDLLRESQMSASERRRLAESETEWTAPIVGQRMFVKNLRQWGVVRQLDDAGRRVRIQVGGIEVAAKAEDLLDYDPSERRQEQIDKSELQALNVPGEKRHTKRSRKIKHALRDAQQMDFGPAQAPPVLLGGIRIGNISRPGSMTLDLHGMRVEEALAEVDRFLDRALLSSFPYVKILHGTGSGRLYKAVHEYLRSHPAPKKFRFGTPEEGGGGITIVDL